ncbi:hypothetical protein BD414DRAFT_578529 [Trametes punicea]|nr:hypothetical protein BD414DRAFT_578529 [Trametes punicea]
MANHKNKKLKRARSNKSDYSKMTPHASLQRLLGDKLALYISVADWGRDHNKVFGGKTTQRGTQTRRKRASSSETQPRGEETTTPEADHGAVRQSPPATSPSIAHSGHERTSPSAQVPPDRVSEGQDRIQPAQAQLTVEEHATSYPTMRQEMYRQYPPCYTPESQLPITGLAAQPIHLRQPSQLPAASALSIHPLAGGPKAIKFSLLIIAQSELVSSQAISLLPEAARADPTDLAISAVNSAGYIHYPVDLAEPGRTAPAYSHASPDWPWQTWGDPQATTGSPSDLANAGAIAAPYEPWCPMPMTRSSERSPARTPSL